MVYNTNLNEQKGEIIIDINEFISVKEGFVFANETYKEYEFINPFKNE